MRVTRFTDVAAFSARVEPYLLRHEAEHNLPLGLLSTLRNTQTYPTYLLALVEDGEGDSAEVVMTMIQTPPHNLVLSLVAPQADPSAVVAALADDLRADHATLPGVTAPNTLALLFAETWQARSGQVFRVSKHERIYRLAAVQPVTGVAGTMRRADEDDRALLLEWLTAFGREAFGDDDLTDATAAADNLLTSPERGVYLWEDATRVVSLAAYSGYTPNGVRIGPVYTPPEERGKGYASACVATLSQMLLDGGRRFCFLFTDLANPTANHIYQTIGYEAVSDVDMYVVE